MTEKYPEIVSRIKTALPPSTQSFIVDCEVVAWDRIKNRLLPFQILSTRKRKEVKESEVEIQVCLFAFDLLYLNSEVHSFYSI